MAKKPQEQTDSEDSKTLKELKKLNPKSHEASIPNETPIITDARIPPRNKNDLLFDTKLTRLKDTKIAAVYTSALTNIAGSIE